MCVTNHGRLRNKSWFINKPSCTQAHSAELIIIYYKVGKIWKGVNGTTAVYFSVKSDLVSVYLK